MYYNMAEDLHYLHTPKNSDTSFITFKLKELGWTVNVTI